MPSINKEQLQMILDKVDSVFEEVARVTKTESVTKVKDLLLGPAIKTIKELLVDARPPSIFVVGRSGAGKSSTINALAGKIVAEVDDGPEPVTAKTIAIPIDFVHNESGETVRWKVFDTRGIFDVLPPDDSTYDNAFDQLLADMELHRPDVIMHIIRIDDIRNAGVDLEVVQRIQRKYHEKVPFLCVPTWIYKFGDDGDIEKQPAQQVRVEDFMTEFIRKFTGGNPKPITPDYKYRGFGIESSNYSAIIPIEAPGPGHVEREWNVETLRNFIGSVLPDEALYEWKVAMGDEQVRKLADELINRFTRNSLGVGAIPVADIVFLIPYQMILVALIGASAGRPLDQSTVIEFFGAMGLNVGGNIGVKQLQKRILIWAGEKTLLRNVMKYVPALGPALGAAVGAASTWAIGQAAKAYFFDNTVREMGPFKAALKAVKELKSKGGK